VLDILQFPNSKSGLLFSHGWRTPYGRLQGDECIFCYTMLQVTCIGAIAKLSTRISQLWYICRWTTI